MDTALCAQNYTVTITDSKGCDTTTTVTIDSPDSLDLSDTAHTDITCFGADDGTATVSPQGGTPGYDYKWHDCSTNNSIGQTTQQATGLSPGSYFAEVSDTNGCADTTVCIPITEPPELTVTATVDQHVQCNGSCDGQASATTSGGSGSISFEWRPQGGSVFST
ncbi:MAG: SprB repeat-containing protein, partial [Flavobacteriales bacterium]